MLHAKGWVILLAHTYNYLGDWDQVAYCLFFLPIRLSRDCALTGEVPGRPGSHQHSSVGSFLEIDEVLGRSTNGTEIAQGEMSLFSRGCGFSLFRFADVFIFIIFRTHRTIIMFFSLM